MATFKLFTINTSRMKLENLFGLCTDTIKMATESLQFLEEPLLKAKLATLTADTAVLATRMNQTYTSPLTPELEELDKRRDVDMLEIERVIKAFLKSSNATKAAAANMLLPVFKKFFLSRKKKLATQTADIGVLHDRVASVGNYLEALTALDIMTIWLDMMDANTLFSTKWDERFSVKVDVTLSAATKFKSTVVKDYEEFCSTLALTLSTLPTAQLKHLFDELNELRKKYAPPHRLKLDREHTTAEPIPTQPYDNDRPILPLTRVWYDGNAGNVELIFSVDFTVTYKNNKKVGEAEMIIHGKGKYTGQYLTTFHIAEM